MSFESDELIQNMGNIWTVQSETSHWSEILDHLMAKTPLKSNGMQPCLLMCSMLSSFNNSQWTEETSFWTFRKEMLPNSCLIKWFYLHNSPRSYFLYFTFHNDGPNVFGFISHWAALLLILIHVTDLLPLNRICIIVFLECHLLF